MIKCCGEELTLKVLKMKPLGILSRSKTVGYCVMCGKIGYEYTSIWQQEEQKVGETRNYNVSDFGPVELIKLR